MKIKEVKQVHNNMYTKRDVHIINIKKAFIF